ncbi:MAG: RagB/SusD family nutrient uptake outer membrane protein [Bacteroidaceae bacterium]|nr:RagB/SusD family nutrient uptake outer membrane protein [Bacteroidaceae bacterium]
MKLFKKTLVLALASGAMLFMGTGCNDYIDIDVENTLAVDEIDYTIADDMYKPVIGCYGRMRSTGIHWALGMLWSGRDDDMCSGRTNDQADALKFGYHGGYQNPTVFWSVPLMWTNMYNIIFDCNSNLATLDRFGENLTPGTADHNKYLSYIGEIKTIRAWAYYHLATFFGPCVIYASSDQTSFRRSTVEKVYDYIIADLESAIPFMEAKRPNQMEHMGAYTKYTAEALAARVALLKGDYAKVKDFTDDIINNGGFSLYSDYYQLFKIPGKLCDESLMEVQVSDFGNAMGDYIGIDQWFNYQGASVKDLVNNKSTAGWLFMRYHPAFLQWADDRGETVRRETSFLVAGEYTREQYIINGTPPKRDADGRLNVEAATSADIPQIYNGKAYLPINQMTGTATTWGRNNNVRVIRYAEVLLMNAEAKVRLGQNGDAPFNEVRQRAEMPRITNVTVDDILDERRMELCSEWGLRYTDLCRTGLAKSVLGKYGWTESKRFVDIPSSHVLTTPELAEDPI